MVSGSIDIFELSTKVTRLAKIRGMEHWHTEDKLGVGLMMRSSSSTSHRKKIVK